METILDPVIVTRSRVGRYRGHDAGTWRVLAWYDVDDEHEDARAVIISHYDCGCAVSLDQLKWWGARTRDPGAIMPDGALVCEDCASVCVADECEAVCIASADPYGDGGSLRVAGPHDYYNTDRVCMGCWEDKWTTCPGCEAEKPYDEMRLIFTTHEPSKYEQHEIVEFSDYLAHDVSDGENVVDKAERDDWNARAALYSETMGVTLYRIERCEECVVNWGHEDSSTLDEWWDTKRAIVFDDDATQAERVRATAKVITNELIADRAAWDRDDIRRVALDSAIEACRSIYQRTCEASQRSLFLPEATLGSLTDWEDLADILYDTFADVSDSHVRGYRAYRCTAGAVLMEVW